MPRRGSGFTLIEILVALAVIAVALAAGMRALAHATDSATLLRHRTLALWVAQNRLAETQLASPAMIMGSEQGSAEQAATRFLWRQTITSTPNPAFRRVEIVVTDPGTPGYALATLVGYIARAPSP